LIFFDIEGDSTKVQLFCHAGEYKGPNFEDLHT